MIRLPALLSRNERDIFDLALGLLTQVCVYGNSMTCQSTQTMPGSILT